MKSILEAVNPYCLCQRLKIYNFNLQEKKHEWQPSCFSKWLPFLVFDEYVFLSMSQEFYVAKSIYN